MKIPQGTFQNQIDPCGLCPRECAAHRSRGGIGECGADGEVRLASATVHFGEEPPITGTRGSGTFFFANCPLSCVFCQNFPISQLGHGKPVSVEWLARRMLILKGRGAHNINIVTGTQYTPQIIEAVELAKRSGFDIPMVWNTSGYEKPETIEMLAGTVDIYLTDIKYADDEVALRLSDAPDYFEISTRAAKRMIEQVGPLETDSAGIGVRGVIIRHLVLPGGLAGTDRVARFIAEEIGRDVPISLLGQFFPAFKGKQVGEVSRRLTAEEYELAKQQVLDAGIELGWFQDLELDETLLDAD